MINGFLNVLKPVGATASDIVSVVRRIYNEKKVGHLGTLDPGATGVLPVALGCATKLFDFLTNKRKHYRAFFTFGAETDTLDSYGILTNQCDFNVSTERLKACAIDFVGEIRQVPPQYSAISVGGVRAYKLARLGERVELKERTVTVYSFELLRQINNNTYVFDIECSGGTYIRSLVRDLAEKVGTVGYMSGLIRLRSGNFDISDAYRIDELENLQLKAIVPIENSLSDLKSYTFGDNCYNYLCNGVRLSCKFGGLRKIYCRGELFGIGESLDNRLIIKYNLRYAKN
ncbi:MAG: tRNA pseudouridine(55) synthase TruB [Corallococcus sp.]|nr:tRNA pseudouridine(55) synthase TruB [Corallococcus sp.]